MKAILLLFLAMLPAATLTAQESFTIPWSSVDGGGGPSASAAEFTLAGSSLGQMTAGDPDSGLPGEFEITGGYWTFDVNLPGDLEPFNASIIGSSIYATAVQPDGKTILVGSFTSVLGVPRSNVARLNADGTLDMGFDPKANGDVTCVAVQADGKVILGGNLVSLQPNGAPVATARSYVARVNADGTLDPGFHPRPNLTVHAMALQADGKLLLGGNFTTLQPNGAPAPTARNKIARVNADGTLDPVFNPNPDNIVSCLAEQADGKVLLGGAFATLMPNGAPTATARGGLARVNADGTLDTTFSPNPDGTVFCVAVQADGKVLLGGAFGGLRPEGAPTATARQSIARVNADGTLDMDFDPRVNNHTYTLAVQADGKVLLGGAFTTLQPKGVGAAAARQYIARVNADGTLDAGFNPKANATVTCVALQPDGKVLLGGSFTALQPSGAPAAIARNRFAMLHNTAATQTLSAPDATRALWQRSGAAPELSRVTFELSTDGGASWTPLGAGTRVGTTADWQRTGLTLPISGQLRARGATAGGYHNASSGIVVSVTALDLAIEAPTLTLPASHTAVGRHIAVAFSLPEAAMPGSVKLSWAPDAPPATVLTLADSQSKPGPHTFTFDEMHPAASAEVASVSGPAFGAFVYEVSLSYQDVAGNPAATVVSTDVSLVLSGPLGGLVTLQPPIIYPGALARISWENWTAGFLGGLLGYQMFLDEVAVAAPGPATEQFFTAPDSPGPHLLTTRIFDTLGNFTDTEALILQVQVPSYSDWKMAHFGDPTASDTGNADNDAFVNLLEYGLVLSPTAFDTGPVGERHAYPEGDRLRIIFTRDPARNDVTIEAQGADDLAGPWTTIATSMPDAVTSGDGYYGGDSPGTGLKTVEVHDIYSVGDPSHPHRFLRLRVSR